LTIDSLAEILDLNGNGSGGKGLVRGVTFTTRGGLNKAALRQANERLVLNTIRQNPRVSRADIVRITGLAPSSVTYIVDRLFQHKMIYEEEVEGPAQVGRRPTALRVQPDARMAVAVEIVKPESRIVLANLDGDIVRKRAVRWTPNHELFFERVHSAIRGVTEPLRPEQTLGVGVGLPGTIDRASGKVIAAENFNWFGIDAGDLMRRQFPFPFYYENSAKLAALSELWLSEREGKPLRDFVFIAVRSGLGTGVIINGQLLQGAHSAAAEFGHTTLYPDGRRCSCGNVGCWEQYASDIALCRLYDELSEKEGRSPRDVDPEAVIRLAREGDSIARRALKEIARNVGLGMVNLIWGLDPEAIVVGDWLAEAWDLVEQNIWEVVRGRVAGFHASGLRIIPSRTSTDCVLLGAAALVLNRFFNSFDNSKPGIATHAVAMQ